jgi:hypothetical protein
LLLASCSASVAQLTKAQRLQREEVACRSIGTPPKIPKTNPSKFFAVSVKVSLITALERSDNASLENVANEVLTAARRETKTGNGESMVRALNKGVAACHKIGLSTTR